MKYSYILKNDWRILRPVTVDDAEFIVKLRNQPHVRGFLNDTSTDVEKQREWIRAYLRRENEYYWIIETLDHQPYGTTSLYHYNAELSQVELGRWAKLADAQRAENVFAGRVQMNDFIFSTLGMKRLVFDVVAANKQVIRYHRLCGAVQIARRDHDVVLNGEWVDQLVFEETPESWQKIRPKICHWAGIDPDRPCGEITRIAV